MTPLPVQVARGAFQRPTEIATRIPGLLDVLEAGRETMTVGFYEILSGDPQTFTYSAEEVKIVLEGELRVQVEDGEDFLAGPLDTIYIPQAAKITFSTENRALAVYVAHRKTAYAALESASA